MRVMPMVHFDLRSPWFVLLRVAARSDRFSRRLRLLFVALAPTLSITLPARSVLAQDEPVQYLEAILSDEDFETVSLELTDEPEIERATKFLLPARDDAELLPPLFQNVSLYLYHRDFLATVFPDRFPLLPMEEYLDLVERRPTREYFAGTLSRLKSPGGLIHGFSIFTDQSSEEELLTAEETAAVFTALSDVFALPGLHYAPETVPARLAARAWEDPGFPVYIGSVSGGSYRAYTSGVAYGRVRLMSAEQLDDAMDAGLLGWQDVLVIERAPSDIEGVIAGLFTAEPQSELSHVAIRMGLRRTPNAYVADAMGVLAGLDGELVRIELTSDEYRIERATPQEADAWWTEHRPRLSRDPSIDVELSTLDRLIELDLAEDSMPPESRYGGKATNLARLQHLLSGSLSLYREEGFAIPVRYFVEFTKMNRLESALEAGRLVTYEEYIAEVAASAELQSDARRRHDALEVLREHARESSVVSSALVDRLADRIREVFGATTRMVRFRSSSNVEDALEFNGAGLYDSESACAADTLDAGDSGPSRCDSEKGSERDIARALRRVWASLWNFRAYEERRYYQVPEELTAMGVLVTRAFLDEEAGGVAFTGNPSSPADGRYVVVVQPGEASVVRPEPGQRAEKDILEVAGGAVVRIVRAQSSSLVPEGEHVLSGAQLEEFGALLWRIEEDFPLRLGVHDRERVLFDVEFKIEPGGGLAVKQVRPFLSAEGGEPSPEFMLRVPESAVACGAFVDGRSPRDVLALEAQIAFVVGEHRLPGDREVFGGNLVEELRFGPDLEPAVPASDGVFKLERTTSGDGWVNYSYEYTQEFTLRDGASFELLLRSLEFRALRGEPVDAERELDEELLLARRPELFGVPDGDLNRWVRFSACGYDSVPSWRVIVELANGDRLVLEEKLGWSLAGSGPADLVRAQVDLGGHSFDITGYEDLVYSAHLHNTLVRYLIVLPVAVDIAGATAPVHALEVVEPDPVMQTAAEVSLLDADLNRISRSEVAFYWRGPAAAEPPGELRRGDVDGSGSVNVTDAVVTLLHLFSGGGDIDCPDAADFDDSGSIDVSDAVIVLAYLFQGVDLSGPPGPVTCGRDPSADALAECGGAGCR